MVLWIARLLRSPCVLAGSLGGYYSAVPGPSGRSFGPTVPSKEARDEAQGQRLWKLTDKLVG